MEGSVTVAPLGHGGVSHGRTTGAWRGRSQAHHWGMEGSVIGAPLGHGGVGHRRATGAWSSRPRAHHWGNQAYVLNTVNIVMAHRDAGAPVGQRRHVGRLPPVVDELAYRLVVLVVHHLEARHVHSAVTVRLQRQLVYALHATRSLISIESIILTTLI